MIYGQIETREPVDRGWSGDRKYCITTGEQEIAVMRNQAKEVLEWYNDMENVVPSWYQRRQLPADY